MGQIYDGKIFISELYLEVNAFSKTFYMHDTSHFSTFFDAKNFL
jgi:hypothetical protein